MLAVLFLADIATTADNPSGSSGTSAWVIVAVVVAVIVIGLGVLWLLRSRRRARAGNQPRD